MALWDRLLRSLFVAVAVGLGWGIRGDFGHLLGAMAPGATLGMGFAYVTGQRSAFRWMPFLAAAGAFFIGLGGMQSYGILHGYAQSDTLINYSYGFFTLVLEGGAWGGLAGAALGLLLEPKRLKLGELVSCIMTTYVAGWAFYYIVVRGLGFHINPPRNDISIQFTGAMIGLFVWLAINRKKIGLKGAMLGYIGFGMGMALGRLFANSIRHAPFDINHWNIMEVSCGFFGGLVFTFGMLGLKLPERPEDSDWPAVGALSIFYVMAFIPLLHLLTRINVKELADSAVQILHVKLAAAVPFVEQIYLLLAGICAIGFLAAFVWYLFWKKDKYRLAAYPVITFSLLMLLFQTVRALYYWIDRPANSVDMRTVNWYLWGTMVLFVVAFETVWPKGEALDSPEKAERVAWKPWVVGSAAVFALIILVASFVNGPKTMTNANTRFPVWSWQDEAKRKQREAAAAKADEAAKAKKAEETAKPAG